MKYRIVAGVQLPTNGVDLFRHEFEFLPSEDPTLHLDEVIKRAKEHRADGLLVAPNIRWGASEFARLNKEVKIIASTSLGSDHFDVAAGKAKEIVLTNLADTSAECVADHTFLLILGACRRLREYNQYMEQGWGRQIAIAETLGIRVYGKALGILGMGKIGQAVARRAQGFGMKVYYSNLNRLPPELEFGAEYCQDFHSMLPRIQILSLHAPLTPETTHIMSREAFALLPQGSVFVNSSRGGLVDETALLDALKSGHLFAAGLDVFQNEPHLKPEIVNTPNLLMTPHAASATEESRLEMTIRALDNLRSFFQGKKPKDSLW